MPLQFSHLQCPRFPQALCSRGGCPLRLGTHLVLHQAPGKIPLCKGSRAEGRKLKTLPRGVEPRPELDPAESEGIGLLTLPSRPLPGRTQLFPPDRGPLPAATQPTSSAPRQKRTPDAGARTPAAISPRRELGSAGNAGCAGCAPRGPRTPGS